MAIKIGDGVVRGGAGSLRNYDSGGPGREIFKSSSGSASGSGGAVASREEIGTGGKRRREKKLQEKAMLL